VSQSSGTVRVFQNGEVMLHIEPLQRPMIWGRFRMDAQEQNGSNRPLGTRAPLADE
jgi:diadenylate cyclase